MVEIPDARAKDIAAWLRAASDLSVPRQNTPMPEWADLLDPQPPSLREQVHSALWTTLYSTTTAEPRKWSGGESASDAVLAIVADAVKAHRHPDEPDFPSSWWDGYHEAQADVERLLRGQS